MVLTDSELATAFLCHDLSRQKLLEHYTHSQMLSEIFPDIEGRRAQHIFTKCLDMRMVIEDDSIRRDMIQEVQKEHFRMMQQPMAPIVP